MFKITTRFFRDGEETDTEVETDEPADILAAFGEALQGDDVSGFYVSHNESGKWIIRADFPKDEETGQAIFDRSHFQQALNINDQIDAVRGADGVPEHVKTAAAQAVADDLALSDDARAKIAAEQAEIQAKADAARQAQDTLASADATLDAAAKAQAEADAAAAMAPHVVTDGVTTSETDTI